MFSADCVIPGLVRVCHDLVMGRHLKTCVRKVTSSVEDEIINGSMVRWLNTQTSELGSLGSNPISKPLYLDDMCKLLYPKGNNNNTCLAELISVHRIKPELI